ncbi:MAG: helix-turn-helix domain-containing protein [Patescibacteria group bacterium]
MSDIKSKLLEFGMSDKETNVYLAMLELGPASVQDIAKKAGVNRATTYVMLETLKRRGLMSSVERGKKTVFAPESPEHLLFLMKDEIYRTEEKKKRLETVLPNLMALFRAVEDKPKVRYFEGEEGVKAGREAMMELTRGTAAGRVFIHYDRNMIELAQYNEETRHKLSTSVARAKVLYSIDDGLKVPTFAKNVEARQIENDAAPFHGECDIFDKFIVVATTRTRPIAVIIESEDIAGLFKSFFDLLWKTVKV